MLNNLLPEGFKDEVSDIASTEHKYKNKIIQIFLSNGYKLVKAPLIEFSTALDNKNSLRIKVNKGEKNLTLRDDITMQIARISSSRLSKMYRPLKLCYYGEVVRNKGSMLRPERQFLQIGAECIGEKSYLADVEMMELSYEALTSVGIKNISIELSSKLFLNKIYDNIGSLSKKDKLKSFIKKKDLTNSLKLVDLKYHKYLIDIFSCTGNFIYKKDNLESLKINDDNISEIENLKKINKKFLKTYKNVSFFLDLTEVDEKYYHKGICFTIFANNVRGEIVKGGRYTSNKISGQEDATGFTCYMDTILRASSNIETIKKIIVPFDISVAEKEKLISKNFVIEKFFGSNEELKKNALNRKFEYCLYKNKIIRLRS